MAYRNGTYVAFHAEGTNVPTDSDFKYYNLLKAWTAREDDDFSMINSHEKTAAVRDSSLKETLRSRLVARLRNSKNFLLIIGTTTKLDRDWVPFEIGYAIDDCHLPIIVTYTDYEYILDPSSHSDLWPRILKERIESESVRSIHISFKKEVIAAAIEYFDMNNLPKYTVTHYTEDAYRKWGIIK